jgi:hypothetical protein
MGGNRILIDPAVISESQQVFQRFIDTIGDVRSREREALSKAVRATIAAAAAAKSPGGADTQADTQKKISAPVAENDDVNKLILLVSRNKDPNRKMTDIARDLAKGNETYAQTLMRERRRILKRRTADK